MPELVHLRADAHADWRQAAEVDHLRIEPLDLRELGGEVLLVRRHSKRAEDLAAQLSQRRAEILVVALAVIGGVVDNREGLVAELRQQLGVGVVLVDHGAVDAMHLGIFVAVGDIGQHRAPHHNRQAELVIHADRGDRGRGAIVCRRSDNFLVCRHPGGDLNRHVGLAFVVEHNELVLVFRLRVGVAQAHREIGRVAAADAVDRDAARERPDKADLDLVFRLGGCGQRARHHHGRKHGDSPGCHVHGPTPVTSSATARLPRFRIGLQRYTALLASPNRLDAVWSIVRGDLRRA